MSTGDFQRGKEFNCPDCLMENGHPDVVPQINFCANCSRKNNNYYNLKRQENHRCPWCGELYNFDRGHYCHVWSKHMKDSCLD